MLIETLEQAVEQLEANVKNLASIVHAYLNYDKTHYMGVLERIDDVRDALEDLDEVVTRL